MKAELEELELNEAKRASLVAVAGNAAMSTVQFATSAATGNVGFIGEAIHNASDSASFFAKRIGYTADRDRIKTLFTRTGAALFAGSGLVAISLGSKNIAENHYEDTGTLPIGIAIGTFAVNTAIARYVANKEDNKGRLKHTHEHANTDAYTGGLYAVGLIGERWVPGIANLAIVSGGMFTTYIAGKHWKEGGHHH